MLLGWSWGPEGRSERAGEEASFNRLLLESKATAKVKQQGWGGVHRNRKPTGHRKEQIPSSSYLPISL